MCWRLGPWNDDAYAPHELAFKVVGTGSVGVDNYIILLYGNGPGDPLFLEVKEQDLSCWSPYVKKARDPAKTHLHQGQRAAEGVFRTQTVADPFLGWTQIAGKDFLVRQWSDHKAAVDEKMLKKRNVFEEYAVLCGRVLAKAHARTGDGAELTGYCGNSERLDVAIAAFALAYADQTEADYDQFCRAIDKGQLKATRGV
jgi:hypothetical protein